MGTKRKAIYNGLKDRDPKRIKESCWVYGIPGGRDSDYQHKKGFNGGKGNNKKPSQANMIEFDELAAVVMKTCVVINSKGWWINIEATRYICGDRNLFSTYKKVNGGERHYIGNATATSIKGKGNKVIKLTSEKR